MQSECVMNDRVTRADVLAAYAVQGAPASEEASSSAAWERVQFIVSELQMTLHLLATGDTLRPGVASPELIAVLMTYLEEVSRLRRDGQLENTSLRAETFWRDYRATLEQMNRILPKIEHQLRDDRSRLTQEQDRLSRASAWNSAAKLTR